MKVLLFNTLYHPYVLGGAEKSVMTLAEELLRQGEEVVIVSTAKYNTTKIINDVKVYYVYIPNFFWRYEASENGVFKKILWRIVDFYNFFTKKLILPILNEEKPDVIHTNNIGGFSISLWEGIKNAGYPLVHTIRDYYCLCSKTSMFKNHSSCLKPCFYCKLYTANKKVASSKVDAVVGISKFILSKHIEENYFRNVDIKKVIYNPIAPVDHRTSYKNISDRLNFGFLGSIGKHKGIEILLKEFSKIENADLLIAGKEHELGYLNYLRAKFNPEDNIKFIGFVDPTEFYKSIDVLIHPALWDEPFGRVIIEANANGVPVLSTRKGGLSEIINEGDNGFFFNHLVDGDLKRSIENFISNAELIKKMRPKCVNFSSNFNRTKITKEYIQVYKAIL